MRYTNCGIILGKIENRKARITKDVILERMRHGGLSVSCARPAGGEDICHRVILAGVSRRAKGEESQFPNFA